MTSGEPSYALRPQVKVCGITNEDDARRSASLGASMLGIVFANTSPRYLSPRDAQTLVSRCPPSFCFVGVFVDEDASRVREIASLVGLQKLQFQGTESPDYCHSFSLPVIKAFRVDENFVRAARHKASDGSHKNSPSDFPQHYDRVSAHLFDSKSSKSQGGSGETFDWRLLNLLEGKENSGNNDTARAKPWILAGGINADNVEQAMTIVRPDALDLSSALAKDDNPREKDKLKMENFFRAIDKANPK